ncbi:MAG: tetratricopeptide repeat protein [Gammaproteobacteria bacterium]|nr:tetratricopeptide repeat protein [Gammaproteobacteria bacterium]
MSRKQQAAIAESFRHAQMLHQDGQLEQAGALYREILGSDPAHFDTLCMLALLEFQSGRGEESLLLLNHAVKVDPNSAVAVTNRGNVLLAMKRYEDALTSYDRALALKANYAEIHFNRGVVLRELARDREALASYDRALALRPEYAEAHNNRGIVLELLSRPLEAIAAYERALGRNPGFAQAHYNRGNALRTLERYEEAADSYSRALGCNPDYVDARINRGNVLRELGHLDEALSDYDVALKLNPVYGDALLNRAIVLNSLNRHAEALASLERALALTPDHPEALCNLGITLRSLNQLPESLVALDRALELRPDYIEACVERSMLMMYMRRFDQAYADIGRALTLDPAYPEAHFCEAVYRLVTAEFARGWEEYEWRWQVKEAGVARAFEAPLWLGHEDLSGKTILLYSEQGYGDTLQFCRYAPRVAALGARVILEVQPPLQPLLARMTGPARVFATGDPLPAFDYRCPLMSLPLAFHTDLRTIPAETPYLGADPARIEAWRIRLSPAAGPRIGIAWSGRPAFRNDHNRSIRLEGFLPLLTDAATFVCLQKELRDHDRELLARHPWIRYVGAELNDFGDTAALVECLDLVISVDTSVAHLAGALGKPTWILLPYHPDWRWLLDREDSPWYSGVRLFRQPRPGDWDSVIARVAAELREPR